jgi:DNA-binding GntR family transcriptional regulator
LADETTPRYQTIANLVEQELALLEPGSQVASEHELAKRFGVNRLTAQAAVEELERRYVVRRSKGKGTFVARRLPYVVSPGSSPSWSASVRAAGGSPTIATVSLQERPASRAVADQLRIDRGQRVFVLVRRRFVDGLIAACTTSHLPGDLLPRFRSRLVDDASLHDVLADHYGIEPVRVWAKVELRPAPVDVAARLELRGAPMVHRLSALLEDVNSDGRVIEFAETWLRPDAVDLVIEMK